MKIIFKERASHTVALHILWSFNDRGYEAVMKQTPQGVPVAIVVEDCESMPLDIRFSSLIMAAVKRIETDIEIGQGELLLQATT